MPAGGPVDVGHAMIKLYVFARGAAGGWEVVARQDTLVRSSRTGVQARLLPWVNVRPMPPTVTPTAGRSGRSSPSTSGASTRTTRSC